MSLPSATRAGRARLLVAVIACLAACAAVSAAAAQAAVFPATPSIADTTASSSCSNPCALRQAVADALAADDSSSTIYLEPGTYDLTQGTLVLDPAAGDKLTLQGDGMFATDVVISAEETPGQRVVQIGDGTNIGAIATTVVTLDMLELTHGDAVDAQGGGAWVEPDATLDLDDSVVQGNTADNSGGGIDVNGGLSVRAA